MVLAKIGAVLGMYLKIGVTVLIVYGVMDIIAIRFLDMDKNKRSIRDPFSVILLVLLWPIIVFISIYSIFTGVYDWRD